MCDSTHTTMHMQVKMDGCAGQRTALGTSLPALTFQLDKGSLCCFLPACIRPADLWASGIPISSLPTGALGLQTLMLCIRLLYGFWDSTSGLQACMTLNHRVISPALYFRFYWQHLVIVAVFLMPCPSPIWCSCLHSCLYILGLYRVMSAWIL